MLARISSFIVFASAVAFASPDSKSIWEGVYTQAQAARGEAAYATECSRCHKDDLSGYGSVLIGQKFTDHWNEDSLDSFYTNIRQTMPRNAPASLSNAVYLDIVAYVLRMNAFPAGEKELTAESVANIRVQGKEGPEPVPDFSLVDVVGCLTQGTDGAWAVTNASEPVRTRNPNDSTAAELQTLKSKPLGAHTFHLLDFASVQSHPVAGQKVEVKGFLIRKPGDDRINPSALQSVAPACEAR